MPTKIGIGFSKNISWEKASREAAHNAKAPLRDAKIDLAIIFCSIHYEPQKILQPIKTILNAHRTIGCSTAGIILPGTVETQGIGIVAISSDEMNFGIGSINAIGFPDSFKAGNTLAQNCISDYGQHARNGFLFISDNKIPNLPAFLNGLQEILGKIFNIVGGTSSDNFQFETNFQFFEDQALQNSVVGLIMGGHSTLGIGSAHGWKPLGKPRVITEAQHNVIKSIDHQKASIFFEEYFSQISDTKDPQVIKNLSILYPLGIRTKGTNTFFLRTIEEILPNGSIVCRGNVPTGATVHTMISNKKLCLAAATQAAQEAFNKIREKEPKLILVIESMARLKILGRTASQEIDKIMEVFNTNVPIIGMYSNSEFYPFRTNETVLKSEMQNQSIVIIALS